MLEAEKKIDDEIHNIVIEQQKLIKELHEIFKKDNKS